MRTIEIVSHCYRYGRVLNYQFSSLFLYPPSRCEVILTVYYCPQDALTREVVHYFTKTTSLEQPASIHFWPTSIDKGSLLRRSIGRNLSAKAALSDTVWFTDCDYFFGEGALDALADADLSAGKIFFPRVTWFNKTHANGDEYAARIDRPQIADIDPADFVEHRPGKAIGGVQIVPGDVARQYGYCPEEKWQQPVTDGEWKDTKEDMAFRKTLDPERKKGLPLDIPNVFRIRQVNTGEVDTLINKGGDGT